MRYLPLYNQLYALQVLEYNFRRFIFWSLKNPLRLKLEKKKKFVWTTKSRFLFCCSFIFQLILFIFETFPITPLRSGSFDLKGVLVFIFLLVFPQPLLLFSLLSLLPYEVFNRRRTINETRKIIANHKNLLVIGITGSYGKTTVKEILTAVLSTKYRVLATPKSYNTLFGIAGVIQKTLKPEHEIFIVEMGAYKKGELAELCRMVKPKIGLLTGITGQHIERFGSLKNIVEAKSELIQALPDDGLAVFNLDSQLCTELYLKTKINKVGYAGIDKPNWVAPDFKAEIISRTPESSTFNLKVSSNNETMKQWNNPQLEIDNLTLNLQAEHNVSNALAAIAVGLYLGLSEGEIRSGLSQVKPPEHRLQIITGAENTVIIDDAYSSNLEGARAAIKLITRFPNYPKIIVTPGMVELGKQQFEENKKLGKLIAESFDYAVIVNKTNRRALLTGLLDGGWFFLTHTLVDHLGFTPKQLENYNVPDEIDEKVFIAENLDQVTKEILPNLMRPGCVVLFENDLPDIYR